MIVQDAPPILLINPIGAQGPQGPQGVPGDLSPEGMAASEAAIASAAAASTSETNAANSAASAANSASNASTYDPTRRFATVALLQASTRAAGGVGTVWQGGNMVFSEAAPSVTDADIVTAAGVKLYALPGALVFPSTGPGGDNAPNIILGAYGAVDLPATTYGNLIGGPRDNNASGGVGYRNRLGANTNLAVILGGDNDIDALAAFNIGHHNAADVADGASHPIMIGTYLHNGGPYAVAMGTNHNIWATKSALVGGDDNRIGTQGTPDNGRNSAGIGGWLNTIDGQYSAALGGYRLAVTASYAVAFGAQAVARYYGTMSNGNGAFGGVNAAQDNMSHRGRLRRQTTTGVATQLTLDGGTTTLSMPTNALWTGRALVSAYRVDAGGLGQTASYEVRFSAISSGSAATIKSSTVTVLHEDNAAWNCDVIASGLVVQIRGQGAAGATINWGATFDIDEMRQL